MILSLILIGIGWVLFYLSMKSWPHNENDKDYKENKSTAGWLLLLGFILHAIAIAIAPESW